jgi:hypothetical protein
MSWVRPAAAMAVPQSHPSADYTLTAFELPGLVMRHDQRDSAAPD